MKGREGRRRGEITTPRISRLIYLYVAFVDGIKVCERVAMKGALRGEESTFYQLCLKEQN
jgi:hypothetical protein